MNLVAEEELMAKLEMTLGQVRGFCLRYQVYPINSDGITCYDIDHLIEGVNRHPLSVPLIKQNAYREVSQARREGRIVEGPCEVCGSTAHIRAHHEDYRRPLDIRWLCQRHHLLYHRSLYSGKVLSLDQYVAETRAKELTDTASLAELPAAAKLEVSI